jgi:hypothetical protein
MILLIGPAVAVVGLVAVFFVMRHKSVEKRSMYSSRRSQYEHKVRAALQRTLAPAKRAEKGSRADVDEGGMPAPVVTYEPSLYAGPPVASPPVKPTHSVPAHPAWDTGPTVPAASTPTFTPPAPPYEPPPFEAPPPEAPAPAVEPPAWTPTPPDQAPMEQAPPERAAPVPAAAATSAGSGASWSVVGETKGTAEPAPPPKKKSKKDAQTATWTLASGEVAGEEDDDGPKRSTPIVAIAQYAVLVVGLVMVLIGVVVMVANSNGA